MRTSSQCTDQRTTPGKTSQATQATRQKRSPDLYVYVVGEDNDCSTKPVTTYCNGPLPAGRSFRVAVVSCTTQACSRSELSEAFQTLDSTVGVGVIVGPVFGATGFILLAILLVLFLRRCKRLQRDSGRDINFSFYEILSLPDLKTEDWPRVPLLHFDEYLRQMHLDANRRFKSEFTELCASQEKKASHFTMRAGNEPLNVMKNRRKDVLPYDHTRVVLSGRRDNTQDYINASYVQGSDSPCGYIATQGPLYSTLSDFWKMICEQRSGVIVMLCDCIEDGKKTVDQYWPDKINSPLQHGDVTVTMTSMSDFPVYTLRELTARMVERQDLKVTQLCLRGWSEGVGSLPFEKLIEIVRLVRQAARHSRGPITVHCNLGIARTSIFIALDLLTRFVDEHDLASEVNVYTVVEGMLECRPNIIQTLDQYMFIHDVLRVIIARKMRSDSGRETSAVYQNTGQTHNEYERIYLHIPDENTYCTLQESQTK